MSNGGARPELALWAQPLTADSFCGEDASFSAEFEAIRAEVDKETSMYAAGGTDWASVLHLATEFLSARSKNVWVLAYAVYAIHRIGNLLECAAAFAVLADVLSHHWDRLYPLPARVQRRAAPLQWLCSRMERSAKTTGFLAENPPGVEALKSECERLQEVLDGTLGQAAPCFTAIFRKIPASAPTPISPDLAPSSVSTAPNPNAPAPQPSGPPAQERSLNSQLAADALPSLVRTIMEQNRHLAEHLLSLNPLDERAYQLHRTALWSTLLHLPHSDPAGRTQLSLVVPKDKIQAYAASLDNKQYAAILPQLERSAAKAPFWLEGHCMVARCLEELGATAALDCVCAALGQLLARFPELLGYSFQCGTPFAPPAVLPWLDGLTARTPGRRPAHPAAEDQAGRSEDASRLEEALTLSQKQDFAAGLQHLAAVPPGRNRPALLQGLLQARYCLAAGKRQAAAQLLHCLYDRLEHWDLLDWEPELTADLLSLLCTAHPKQHGATAEMVRRLHWLSPESAIALFPDH